MEKMEIPLNFSCIVESDNEMHLLAHQCMNAIYAIHLTQFSYKFENRGIEYWIWSSFLISGIDTYNTEEEMILKIYSMLKLKSTLQETPSYFSLV
jgi:hypothetical protein